MGLGLKKFLSSLVTRDKKIGLALGSGAARGIAHLGVINVLLEEGIPIDCVAGTSAGALVGAFYAAGKIDELHRYASSLSVKSSIELVDPMFPLTGLIEGRKVEKFFRRYFGDLTIESLNIPFACVAADFYTGEEIVLTRGDLVTAVRASISIPGIFKPVNSDNMLLVDGGVVNPVPVKVARDLGADVIIAVNVSPRARQTGKVTIADINRDLITPPARKGTSDPPNIFEIILGSINIMEVEIAKMKIKSEKPDIVINPELSGIGLFDFHKYRQGVKGGERAVWNVMRKVERLVR
jgi:NTE family protein